MKVGDYIRTKIGISKCIRVIPVRENSFMYEFDKEVYEEVNYLIASELEKYKSSPNIIDLIKVGDYVNGECVSCITKNNYIEIGYGEELEGLHNEDIKSIVTKEQLESMEYKI